MAHNFKKQFGQNFLRGDRFVHKMVEALGEIENQIVIEIGPGDGRVTNVLLHKGAKVVAIEIDYDLIPKLIGRFRENKNFDLIHTDIMQLEISAALAKFPASPASYKVVGSLPYNIAKQIIAKLIQEQNKPETMAFIVQEEVAQDYVAQAPKASFLSNWLRLFAEVKKLETIPAKQFFPVPKVNGAILQITPKNLTPEEWRRAEGLGDFIRQGFSAPRKTLSNNLATLSAPGEMRELLSEYGLSATARPAEITPEIWQNLHLALAERQNV